MNEILQFLTDNHIFYLATIDGSTPKVRPFGFVMAYKGKLCFCTNNFKDVYRQLKVNPEFEISSTSETMEWIRLKGEATFITNLDSKQAVLDAEPSLKKIYSIDDPTFEVFCADKVEATFYNMKGETRTVKL